MLGELRVVFKYLLTDVNNMKTSTVPSFVEKQQYGKKKKKPMKKCGKGKK